MSVKLAKVTDNIESNVVYTQAGSISHGVHTVFEPTEDEHLDDVEILVDCE